MPAKGFVAIVPKSTDTGAPVDQVSATFLDGVTVTANVRPS